MSEPSSGRLVIVSGPSGAGKSVVVRQLLATCRAPLVLSISATTRKPRSGEQDGVHYHFLSHAEFARRIAAGEFLEWEKVYGRDDWYGTLKSEVATGLAAGKWVILEIDVHGALAVLKIHPEAITFFVHAGSLAELRRRLELRCSETPESLARRLEVAQSELELAQRYDHFVINDVIERTAAEMCDILMQSAHQTRSSA